MHFRRLVEAGNFAVAAAASRLVRLASYKGLALSPVLEESFAQAERGHYWLYLPITPRVDLMKVEPVAPAVGVPDVVAFLC